MMANELCSSNALQPGFRTDWAIAWASSVVQEVPRSVEVVRSNEINEAFRLAFATRSLLLKTGPALVREYERIRWLEGRLPAPEALGFSTQMGTDAILMSALGGDDLADLSASQPPQSIVMRLADALKVMHATSTADWPFGGSGVLVHGDACLPNFLYSGSHLTGYIDLGDLAMKVTPRSISLPRYGASTITWGRDAGCHFCVNMEWTGLTMRWWSAFD